MSEIDLVDVALDRVREMRERGNSSTSGVCEVPGADLLADAEMIEILAEEIILLRSEMIEAGLNPSRRVS